MIPWVCQESNIFVKNEMNIWANTWNYCIFSPISLDQPPLPYSSQLYSPSTTLQHPKINTSITYTLITVALNNPSIYFSHAVKRKDQLQKGQISKGEGGNGSPILGDANRSRFEDRMTGILKWHWEEICLVSCWQGCSSEMRPRLFRIIGSHVVQRVSSRGHCSLHGV